MWLGRILLVIGALSLADSWPSSIGSNRKKQVSPNIIPSETMLPSSRRQILRHAVTALSIPSVFLPEKSHAACLQGDLRPVCIGIYKIPDEEIYPFFSTPEEFQKFWPDLTYVPRIEKPSSFESAISLLQTQRVLAEEIKQQVFRGNLEEAGIGVLGLIPQIANGCNRVLQDLAETKIRVSGGMVKGGDSETLPPVFQKLKNQVIDVNFYWSDCDSVIGQGLRGELGTVAVAQIRVLESLKDATNALDGFLATAALLSSKTPNKGGGE